MHFFSWIVCGFKNQVIVFKKILENCDKLFRLYFWTGGVLFFLVYYFFNFVLRVSGLSKEVTAL